MVKGHVLDWLSHSWSKPGNPSTREHFIDGGIVRYRVSQSSGVAHANWHHFRHTAPSLNTLVNRAALLYWSKSNVGKQRRNIWEPISGGNLWMKGSWISFNLLPSEWCFTFSFIISLSNCSICFQITSLSVHAEQGPPLNIVQVTGWSLALSPLQQLQSLGFTIGSLMNCLCHWRNLMRWLRWVSKLISKEWVKYQMEGYCDVVPTSD